jgi:large subunit ribosomal protein L4e
MKIAVLSINNEEIGKKDLPIQFDEPVNLNLIQRAVLAEQSRKRQSYGAFPRAGKRSSAKVSRQRRAYRGAYGIGISRVPRKVLSRRGMRFFWQGAFAPGTVGGRRAHPPKAEKVWIKKINRKEENKAVRSAIAATMSKELVIARGHIAPKNYPFVVESRIEELKKTRESRKVLESLGLKEELARTAKKKVRAGRGKLRGRKHRLKSGPLLVVSKNCALEVAARNIAGVKIVEVANLNAELLAPGAKPARLTLFTDAALDRLNREGLYI